MTASLPTIPKPTPFEQLLSLTGKSAIVTGGSRGLGRSTVLSLAAGRDLMVRKKKMEEGGATAGSNLTNLPTF